MSAEVPARRAYDMEDVTRGLTALALAAGNTRAASRRLRAMGTPIPQRTLAAWVDRHSDLYERVREEVAGRLQRVIAAQMEDVAQASAELTQEMVARLRQEYRELPLRDLPGAIRNLGVTAAVATDKRQVLRERPVTIIERRTPEDVIRKLVQAGVAEVVESTAEEDSAELSEIAA